MPRATILSDIFLCRLLHNLLLQSSRDTKDVFFGPRDASVLKTSAVMTSPLLPEVGMERKLE